MRRTHGASSSLVDDCSPVDLLALANLSKGEGWREGIRVVRGYKLVGSKSVRFTFCPWILAQFQPCQFLHPLVILFFISGGENSENSGLLFSSSLLFNRSSSSFFEEFFERRLPFQFYSNCSVTRDYAITFPSFEKKSRVKSVEVDEISTMSFSLFLLEFYHR